NDFADQANRADVEQQYFEPLLELLASVAETDDPILRDLYLGEWRRFAPHRAGLGVLVEYFRAILPEHEAAITARVADDGPAIREWLSALHATLTAEPTRPFRLLMVGDCLMGEVQTFLRSAAAARGVSCDFRYFYFSSLMGADIE